MPVKHRLDFRGNRRINSVLYIASVTQHRDLDDARVYIDRKLGEGKTRREARRAHKRHLANRVIRRMWNDESRRRRTTRHTRRLTRERRTVRAIAWRPQCLRNAFAGWVEGSRARANSLSRSVPAV